MESQWVDGWLVGWVALTRFSLHVFLRSRFVSCFELASRRSTRGLPDGKDRVRLSGAATVIRATFRVIESFLAPRSQRRGCSPFTPLYLETVAFAFIAKPTKCRVLDIRLFDRAGLFVARPMEKKKSEERAKYETRRRREGEHGRARAARGGRAAPRRVGA